MALRVLIVDDALFMRNMLKEIFLKENCQVVGEAVNGAEAVELYRQLRPDLVTLDIVMPVKSGIEALQEIRREDPSARVIICSAMGQESLILQAVKAGAQDFIVKPFKEDKVLEVIRRLVSQT
ncbi:MAG: response regulator [Desulfuromonadaceae bacterium]|jgi:two-component system, chemotaxis family, chemotaxis protein CheY